MKRLLSGVYAFLVLQGMGLLFRLKPELRRSLLDDREGRYRQVFNASFQFQTRDGGVKLYARFGEGRMHAGFGALPHPDVTLTLKDDDALRRFFSVTSPPDILISMLENTLSADGNLSYLAKFGYLSSVITHKPGRAAETPEPLKDVWSHREPMRLQREQAAPADNVRFLTDPYLSEYTLADFPRLKAMRERLFTAPSEVCTERPRLVTEYYMQHGFEKDAAGRDIDPYLRQAGAFHHLLTHKAPIIRDEDLLAGTTTSKEVGVVIYPEMGGTILWPELLTMGERELNPYVIAKEDIDVLNLDVFPYWLERNVREFARAQNGNPECQRLEERWVLYFMWKTQAVSHTIPDYESVLRRGLLDIRREAAEREAEERAKGAATQGATRENRKANFYPAVQLVIDGVLDYAARLAGRAQALADDLPEGHPRRAELQEMARICQRVPAQPAETLHEAVNAIWICKLALHQENMNAGLSIGRLDQLLNPYFLADLEKATDREDAIRQATELVGHFFLKCADHLPMAPDIGNRLFGGSSSDQALTVGGVDQNGGNAVTDMTYIILKVTEMLSLRDPNVNARYAPGVNSDTYLRRLCEVNLITAATPSLHNDNAVIAALEHQGFTPEDARDWGATGCVEPTSCGRHFGHTNSMLLNLVAPLEMALHDGVHPLVGERIGPATGDPARPGMFPTFADFRQAYLTQLGYVIDQSVTYNNQLGRAHQYLHPTPFLSALIAGTLEAGRDVIDGGARYNSSGAALVSITDVVDSLMTIQQLVYEEKQVDWGALLAAIKADFSGYEALQARILNKVPKFGTDDPEPRRLAQDVIDFIYDRYQSHENYRGGRYTSGFWSMSNHVGFGTLSGALPSGRKRGQPFTPGITPAPGHNDDLLANIRTIAALDPVKMPNNIAFNVKLVPGPSDSHSQILGRFVAYVKTYFDLGGMQMQFNVVSSETLRQAMAHPEDYRWLLVRISGYNAYFIELNRDMQLELIARAERRLG